ncbi:MAG: hypothetical protein ABSG05_02150 [Candidatus Pacearchaeota archaeon]|jgi:hypothetical protein
MDFILSLLEVSIVLAVFVWGEVLVRFLLGFTRWTGDLIGFGIFIFIILILSLFSQEVAQFILDKFGENVAWIFFVFVLIGAWINYRKKY